MSSDIDRFRKFLEPYLGKTEKPAPKPDTYVVPYRCGNCGTVANVRFKQGVVAPDGAIKCPRCGTRRTRKVV